MKEGIMKYLIVIFSILVFIIPVSTIAQSTYYQKELDKLFPLKSFDRDEFSRNVDKILGGNPYFINVQAETNKILEKQLPKIWRQVFPGISWLGRLDKGRASYWRKTVNDYSARTYNDVLRQKKYLISLRKFMMAEFEKRKRDKKTEGGVKYYPYAK